MLEKPALQDESLIAYVQQTYGLFVLEVVFLPLGADPNAAVYRAVTADHTSYFVKLRRGAFDDTSVALPKFLSDQGVAQIIPPLATKTGPLWGLLGSFTVILYPYVEGHNGYEIALSDSHWRTFGTALRHIHASVVPPALLRAIPQETYSAQGRESVKRFLSQLEDNVFNDPTAIQLAALLKAKHDTISDLVARSERLARMLQAYTPELIVCHSDIHAGNILIDRNGNFYIVDWDNPILAPKERDLMFVGGGQGFIGHTAQEEETLFYEGYGQTQLDPIALAYYRYERIVQDIAAFCEQIFLTNEGDEDREQALYYLARNFIPGSVLEGAYASDRTGVK